MGEDTKPVKEGENMLSIMDLHVSYGTISALRGVDLRVQEGEVVTIVGANGAGKTTLLKTISGLLSPRQGSIRFQDKVISRKPPHQILAYGVTHVCEGRGIFRQMTVFENLMMGAYRRKDKQAVKQDLDMVLERFPRLQQRLLQKGGTLSGGEQQMLAIGRALLSRPALLLLDEPSLGLAPLIVREIFNIISELKEKGITILLVEQNAAQALRVADRGYVFELGRVVMEGPSTQLLGNKEVLTAYLGRNKAN
ncbi:MAG: ABC transporter ATP-binding protein [Desulfitobacteriaceae bacterium]